MESKLYNVEEVINFINEGRLLVLSGDERALNQLPRGNWIAGTIPYFMDIDMGKFSQTQIYVNEIDTHGGDFKIKEYNSSNIDNLISDSFSNGYTFIIIPPFQQIHQDYAIKSEDMEGLYNNPVVGWVCGSDLSTIDIPKTFNGQLLQSYTDKAIVLHVQLPENSFAQINIVNIFDKDDNSPEIEFYIDSFDVINCLVNGVETNLAAYINQHNIDIKLPLIADYSGAAINVSIKEVDLENGVVSFYAPVFKSKKYQFAKPIFDYIKKFEIDTLDIDTNLDFSCNCILNYLYGELENKKISNVKGPITFGEIGYQLLNQTLVTLQVEKL